MLHAPWRRLDRLASAVCIAMFPVVLLASPGIGTRYFHNDHLGSTVAVSDRAGNVRTRILYRPYGEPQVVGAGDAWVRYTGKAPDAETGKYYFDARYLDPALARFLSTDPARQIPSPYAYVGDAPLVNVDPNGKVFSAEEGALIVAASSGTAIDMGGGARRVPDLIDVMVRRARRLGIANLPLESPLIHREPLRLGEWGDYRGVSLGYVMMDLYVDLVDLRNELKPKYRAAIDGKREIRRLEKKLIKLKEDSEKANVFLGAVDKYGEKRIVEKMRIRGRIDSNNNEIAIISDQLEASIRNVGSEDPVLMLKKLQTANKMLNTIDQIVNYTPGLRPTRPAPVRIPRLRPTRAAPSIPPRL